ncbi:MAG: NADH-quinone oxidoreductase subunit D [Holosporales bacterium]|nr:NADH-quinone oxidoreductase subunit D [Holosporales bacterium]
MILEPRQDGRYELNYGPHHPSTHGVLRLLLTLRGEAVTNCEPVIGYLHRSVEKLIQDKPYLSILPYVDRLDYISSLIYEHAYVIAIEKLLKIDAPLRSKYIRVIMDELTRISSHLMMIGTMSFDLGCLSLFLYCLEEREKILQIFEEVTGARMHPAYYIPGGVKGDLTPEHINKITKYLTQLQFLYDAIDKLVLNNRIFKERTKGIGIISSELAIYSGITGPNLRASGIKYDTRIDSQYGIYHLLELYHITLQEGDCYSRLHMRFLEIKQSVELIKQCITQIEPGEFYENSAENSMSSLRGGAQTNPQMQICTSCESTRGEVGIHLFTRNDNSRPYRLHFKSQSLLHIQILKKIIPGNKLADCPAILGSLDFLMGDCDR